MRFYRLEIYAHDGEPLLSRDLPTLAHALDAIARAVHDAQFGSMRLLEYTPREMFAYTNPRVPQE